MYATIASVFVSFLLRACYNFLSVAVNSNVVFNPECNFSRMCSRCGKRQHSRPTAIVTTDMRHRRLPVLLAAYIFVARLYTSAGNFRNSRVWARHAACCIVGHDQRANTPGARTLPCCCVCNYLIINHDPGASPDDSRQQVKYRFVIAVTSASVLPDCSCHLRVEVNVKFHEQHLRAPHVFTRARI